MSFVSQHYKYNLRAVHYNLCPNFYFPAQYLLPDSEMGKSGSQCLYIETNSWNILIVLSGNLNDSVSFHNGDVVGVFGRHSEGHDVTIKATTD